MLLEIILALLLGVSFGTFTGLIPGIHINLVGAILITLSISILAKIPSTYLTTFIVAMAITHTFIDFIPSIFLGCPDTDTELSVLPGHQLLKKGLGYEAIILTTYGSLAAIFVLILISFPSIILIEKTYPLIQKIIPYLLILVSLILIFIEKKKFSALKVFLLTGMLGLIVLNSPNLKEPLLPLLTGLFGSSMLILSIKNKTKIPKQKIKKPFVKIRKPLLGSIIAAPLCSFLPGMGSGQAAVIGNLISKTDRRGFLVLLGATNTLVMGFSFISLYVISKTRTGAAVAVKEILGKISPNFLIIIFLIIFTTGILSFFLTEKLAKFFSTKMQNINYTKISILTLIILTTIVIIVSGIFGLLIFFVSTATGIYGIQTKVRRTNMMGCLLIPTIVLYLI